MKLYSINDILNAVDDLNKIKKNKENSSIKPEKNNSIKDRTNIPVHTLKLIQDAENFKN